MKSEREPTVQEKTLFDLLMKAGTEGHLFMTVVRLSGVERAIIAAETEVSGEKGFVPIGIVVSPGEMQKMTVQGAAPMRVDIRNSRVEASLQDPADIN